MATIFLLCVAVQYNDPDPFRWIAIYGFAAVSCFLWLSRRFIWQMPAVITLIALVWATTIIPDLIGKNLPTRQVFGTMHMITQAVEEAREFLGLLIVAGWMMALALSGRRSARVTKG